MRLFRQVYPRLDSSSSSSPRLFSDNLTSYLIYYLLLTCLPADARTDKVFGFVKKKQLKKVPPIWAAVLPGAIWSCGFFCSLDGVDILGMGVGYVITAVGPVAVSGMISTLVFDEIKGVPQKARFWTAIGLQAAAQ